MNAQDFVQKYLNSRSQYVQEKFGSVSVTLAASCLSDLPMVEVNWPGIGGVAAVTALEFAADLTAASALALGVERIIDEWDGVDRWKHPDDR